MMKSMRSKIFPRKVIIQSVFSAASECSQLDSLGGNMNDDRVQLELERKKDSSFGGILYALVVF